MASVLDERNILVYQNVPKLIKILTGFNTSDENFKRCLNFIYSHLKYHRFLTVNSHEVKRDFDGICEKLRFSNFHDTEKKFKKLVEETVTHEIAVNHYEKDAVYSILSLLNCLAYDPISNLKKKLLKGEELITFKPLRVKAPAQESQTFISSLLKDNFKLQKNETDSELSEWTDSDEDEDKNLDSDETVEKNSPTHSNVPSNSLKPPEKPTAFKTVKIDNSIKWLCDNVQHSWWTVDVYESEATSSHHPSANFCKLWQKHIADVSIGFIKPQPFSLVTEYCLLREILWMFSNPVDCKFFKIEKDEIIVRPDVTLSSSMPESLQVFLKDILRSMNLMKAFKTDIIKAYASPTQSHTMETYRTIVESYLNRILEFILEEEVVVQSQAEHYTIVSLHDKLRPRLKMLEILWSIHSTCVLDETKFPCHIVSSYLVASLYHLVQTTCSKEKKNFAMLLLVKCLKPFLEIFEIWWTEARLDDLKHEFLMEKSNENGKVLPRLFVKNKEKSFYLKDEVSKKINDDPIFNLMLNYSVKASFTLDIIARLDRFHDMRQMLNDSSSLYEEFSNQIKTEIDNFAQRKQKCQKSIQEEKSISKNQKIVEDIRREMLANGDDLLLLAFQSTFDQITADHEVPVDNQLQMFDDLSKVSDFVLLPLERSIYRILDELLKKKIEIAEHFVMNIYLHELEIEQSFQEIRKVFFLESNELINFFYLSLFPQMEEGNSAWANPYVLTVAFNEAISSSRQSNLAPLFGVAVGSFTHHTVLESIDALSLSFNVNENLINVFNPYSLDKYNQVFRFLLKIKWGQRVLSRLRYPDFFKSRKPYAKMQMMDLIIKRLSLTRFAMQHSVNSLHNHLMVMLQGLSHQLDTKVANAKNISQLISFHKSFVDASFEKTFLGADSENLLGIIIEMLKLVKVLKDEWLNITAFASLDQAGVIEDSISLNDLNNNSIEIEKTFSICESEMKILLDV